MRPVTSSDSAVRDKFAQAITSAKTAADFLSPWLTNKLLSSDNQQLLDDYYKKFNGLKSPRLKHFYSSQLMETEQLIQSLGKPRLLEIGVGTGTEGLWFAMNGADVTGIDVYKSLTGVASERLAILESVCGRRLACRVENIPLLKFKSPEKFDIIWLEQAFHHLEPRTQVVDAIGELLRPGGYVVLSEANALNPLLQLQLFRARRFNVFKTVHFEGEPVLVGNERILSARSLARNLAKVGVTKRSVRYFRLFPSNEMFEPLFGIERRIKWPWLAAIYTHYNFVGQKAE